MNESRRQQLIDRYDEFIAKFLPKGSKILSSQDHKQIIVGSDVWGVKMLLKSRSDSRTLANYYKFTLRDIDANINFGDDRYDEPRLRYWNKEHSFQEVKDFDPFLHQSLNIFISPFYRIKSIMGYNMGFDIGFKLAYDNDVIVEIPESVDEIYGMKVDKAYLPDTLASDDTVNTFKDFMGSL